MQPPQSPQPSRCSHTRMSRRPDVRSPRRCYASLPCLRPTCDPPCRPPCLTSPCRWIRLTGRSPGCWTWGRSTRSTTSASSSSRPGSRSPCKSPRACARDLARAHWSPIQWCHSPGITSEPAAKLQQDREGLCGVLRGRPHQTHLPAHSGTTPSSGCRRPRSRGFRGDRGVSRAGVELDSDFHPKPSPGVDPPLRPHCPAGPRPDAVPSRDVPPL